MAPSDAGLLTGEGGKVGGGEKVVIKVLPLPIPVGTPVATPVHIAVPSYPPYVGSNNSNRRSESPQYVYHTNDYPYSNGLFGGFGGSKTLTLTDIALGTMMIRA